MRAKSAFCIIIIYFMLISNCIAASDSNLPYKEGELLVRFAPKSNGLQCSAVERNQILASFNAGEVIHSYKRVSGLTLVKLPEGIKVRDAIENLKSKSEFLYVEPNWKIKLRSTIPNDTRFSELWGLNNTGQSGGTPNADINAPEAWDIITDSDIIVAVLDSGIDFNHLDLAANIWTDANGHHGHDFYGNDPDPTDYDGHGTMVAGGIGAVGDNNEGVTGVCWNVKIMNLRITGDYIEGMVSDAIEAIQYAIINGAKVLNCSWGFYKDDTIPAVAQALKDAIEDADAAGVLIVAAAANDGLNNDEWLLYPASYDCNNIISAMATDDHDGVASEYGVSSNYGPNTVDLGAPGSRILTCSRNNNYDWSSGNSTSMAAPYVSGACALVWSAHSNWTHLQVKEAILNSVDRLPSLEGLCVTEGRLNLYKALNYCPVPPPVCEVNLIVTDDVAGCIAPDDFFNYTICWSTPCDINDVNIIDYLPAYVDFNSCSDGGVYNELNHTVTWNLGHRQANDSNCFTLQVKVAQDAPQGGTLTNKTRLYSGRRIFKIVLEQTPVCCMHPVVYVDANRPADGNGGNWQTAYKELRNALSAVRDGNCGCADQIWVAKGTYKPANDVNYFATFAMLDGIDMYGHFEGWEDSIEQRNLADSNNETILSGDINDDNNGDVENIVTAADALLDGFTIKKSQSSGIFCSGSTTTIANCVFKNNGNGIYCTYNSDVTITNTFVNENGYGGIFCNDANIVDIDHCTVGPNNVTYGLYASSCTVNATDSIFSGNTYYGGILASSSNLTVERCDISDNSCGITCTGSTYADIQRCTIQRNGASGLLVNDSGSIVNAALNIISDNSSDGVSISYSSSSNCRLLSNLIYRNNNYGMYVGSPAEIRNNTIVCNDSCGIYGYGDPNINSNIIWGNGSSFGGGTFTKVNYNCIEGNHPGTGNIDQYPQFRDIDANDYHLTDDSNCIDAGDPNFSSSTEKDIDGENRVIDGDSNGTVRVDMGADEYYWSPADFDKDEIVNFIDYVPFARSWRLIDANISLDDDNDVDFIDLSLFCADWLWVPGWLLDDYERGFGGEGAYFAEGFGNGEMMISMQVEEGFMLESAAFEVEQAVDVNELVDWLDELWLSGDLNEAMNEQEYLEFRNAIEESENSK